MGQYILKTLGCKANLSDSQLIEQDLQKRGWKPASVKEDQTEDVQLCVINSCTVTDEADRQTRKLASKLARENPNATIVVTGCAAEVDPQSLLAAKGVHVVIGNQNKHHFADLLESSHILKAKNPPPQATTIGTVQSYEQILSKHPIDREWPPASTSFLPPPTKLHGYSEKTRAFLKIQEGCNSFCTYCIIPYGRGPSRSLGPDQLLGQVRGLIDSGIREVVITGTNIGDYRYDEGGKQTLLGDLLERILAETDLERLRVSSLDPTEINLQILDLMKTNPRLCPHFHVSLQSPHTRILKLMKRNYTFDQVQRCLHEIANIPSPLGGVFVGMDVITGFPGETEEVFQWTYETLKSLPWHRLHVFPYSERQGTPATRLPEKVSQAVRMRRARELNQLSMNRLSEKYREILSQAQNQNKGLSSVLLERSSDPNWLSGYTPNYLRIMIRKNDSLEATRNGLVDVVPIDLMLDPKVGEAALISKVVGKQVPNDHPSATSLHELKRPS